MSKIDLVIKPRATLDWQAFAREASPRSIALDGIVTGGPRWDEKALLLNLDHHDGCVREATMSTSKQALFAIKGGVMKRFGGEATLWVNDPDQDTSLATWLLMHHKQFEGVQSHPIINRLLELTDRWDITGGAYPTALDDALLETHAWVFDPYQSLRVSGALATADEGIMRSSFEAVHARLSACLLGQAGSKPLRTEATVLHDSPHGYKVVDELGGNEARYRLFSEGMDAFVSLVARLPGNPVGVSERSERRWGSVAPPAEAPLVGARFVYSIGRRSQYVRFPLQEIFFALNVAEPRRGGFTVPGPGWGGSTIIGGSPRDGGSRLTWEQIVEVIDGVMGPLKGGG